MTEKKRISEIITELKVVYPEVKCALNYTTDFELLFATRLSAQCTDIRVNIVTEELFKQFTTLEEYANAEVSDIEKIIKTCGLFHTKAKDIKEASIKLLNDFSGKVPDNMEDLLSLPGIGRKTANLILGDIFGKPAVVADTHCIRLSNRLGLVPPTKDPQKVEMTLKKIIPEDEQLGLSHRLVFHGRNVCNARSPKCSECSLTHLCPYFYELQK